MQLQLAQRQEHLLQATTSAPQRPAQPQAHLLQAPLLQEPMLAPPQQAQRREHLQARHPQVRLQARRPAKRATVVPRPGPPLRNTPSLLTDQEQTHEHRHTLKMKKDGQRESKQCKRKVNTAVHPYIAPLECRQYLEPVTHLEPDLAEHLQVWVSKLVRIRQVPQRQHLGYRLGKEL